MYKQQVQRFYRELWDAHDKQAMGSILHPDVTFRGSLGDEKQGHAGFAEYVDKVHHALDSYQCHIEALVEEGSKVFARMRFSGIHRDHFMGYAPTNKRVSWAGCALFTFNDSLISEVWVLGDLKGLEQQLEANKSAGL